MVLSRLKLCHRCVAFSRSTGVWMVTAVLGNGAIIFQRARITGKAWLPYPIPLGCRRDRAPNWSHQDICADPVNDELIAQSICFCQAVRYGIIANFYDHPFACIKLFSNDSVEVWWVLMMRRACLVTKSTQLRLQKVIELASIMCSGLMMPRWVIG